MADTGNDGHGAPGRDGTTMVSSNSTLSTLSFSPPNTKTGTSTRPRSALTSSEIAAAGRSCVAAPAGTAHAILNDLFPRCMGEGNLREDVVDRPCRRLGDRISSLHAFANILRQRLDQSRRRLDKDEPCQSHELPRSKKLGNLSAFGGHFVIKGGETFYACRAIL